MDTNGERGYRNELIQCSATAAADFDRRYKSVSQARRAVPTAWCSGDPDTKRRRRVASYKAYSVEWKVKESLRKGLRWVKDKCSEFVRSW